ncbi:hypothetical protein MTO96_019878 [Rhipicephalus appendiculatus]
MGSCGVRTDSRLSGRATARLAAEDCSERVRAGGDPGFVAVARLTRYTGLSSKRASPMPALLKIVFHDCSEMASGDVARNVSLPPVASRQRLETSSRGTARLVLYTPPSRSTTTREDVKMSLNKCCPTTSR